jgi:hypothetical protein
MKKIISMFAMAVGLAVVTAYAVPPIEYLSSTSLGIDYSGMWRGEKITAQDVPGHESVHHLNVRYAPVPYVMLSLGFGVASFTVDAYRQTQFKGNYNFSPSLGLGVYSPFLLKKALRLTAGANAYFLYSKNEDKSFIYSGPFINPSAGAVFSLGEYLDLEAGARWNFIFGRMQHSGGTQTDFSNRETLRAYISATMYAPSEGAYMLVDFDASPDIDLDWSKGPAESSIGIAVGIILRQKNDNLSKKTINDAEYPGFKEMIKKTDDMEKELK